ncbi:MAG: Holliday junction branch migration protein RuvA [Bacteroidetes bacterium]|nr:Holliday junction branch migration protein RuvA [Bacteroidota bacterium]
MIAYIKGKIIYKEPTFIIAEANNIGYEIKISMFTYDKIKEKEHCELHTYLQIKEDSHSLYGFLNSEEKKSFISLISVKGVGPSVAMSILSSVDVSDLISAIGTEDLALIKSIKGVGPKMAQRIVLELKDKLGKMSDSLNYIKYDGNNNNLSALREQSLAALIKLGIPKSAAEKSIQEIIKKEGQDIDIETLIKLALNPA